MARHSHGPYHLEHPGVGEKVKWKWVCLKCLEDNPRNGSLLRTICLDVERHRNFPKVQVWWWAEKNHLEVYDHETPGRIPELRPMPFSKFDGKFALCDPSRCWGYKCKFAHSIEEREIWNAKKHKPKATKSSKSIKL